MSAFSTGQAVGNSLVCVYAVFYFHVGELPPSIGWFVMIMIRMWTEMVALPVVPFD